jgi:hypothetical protein
MSRTLFILGAGASAKAGAPLMKDFLNAVEDIGRDSRRAGPFQSSFELVANAQIELGSLFAKANVEPYNVETVFGLFEMARTIGRLGRFASTQLDELHSAIRLVIARTLEMSVQFPCRAAEVLPPLPYGEFARLLQRVGRQNSNDPPALITFNYDLALDYALHYYAMPAEYGLKEGPRTNAVKRLKLHGSRNWGRCPACGDIVPWQLGEFFAGHRLNPHDSGAAYLDISTHFPRLKHCGGQPVLPEPVLVPPTWNKVGQQVEKGLARVWGCAAAHLSGAERIYVIGYSFPANDEFFHYLFALGSIGPTRVRRFCVIDPRAEELSSHYEALLGPTSRGAVAKLPITFEEAIPQLEKELIS